MGCTKDCGWLVDGGKHCGLCTSISWSELDESWDIIEFSWLTLVSITQAEFVVVLGILGLWKLGHRPLPSRYSKIKQYISKTSWKQVFKTANHCDDTGNTGFHMDRLWELYSSLWDSEYWNLRPHPHETWKVLTCASCKQAQTFKIQTALVYNSKYGLKSDKFLPGYWKHVLRPHLSREQDSTCPWNSTYKIKLFQA